MVFLSKWTHPNLRKCTANQKKDGDDLDESTCSEFSEKGQQNQYKIVLRARRN